MPISFTCRRCQKAYTVPDQFAGRTSQCRQCGANLRIPAGPEPLLADPALYGVAAAPGGAAVPAGAAISAAAPTFVPVCEDPAPGFGTKKLVFFGSLACVALLVAAGMAFAGWYFLFSASPAKNTSADVQPGKKDIGLPAKTTNDDVQSPRDEWTRFLPADCVLITSVRIGELQANEAWKQMLQEKPQNKMEMYYGLGKDNVIQLIRARPRKNLKDKPDEWRFAIAIIMTRQPARAEDIKATLMNSRDRAKISEFREVKAGRFTMYQANSTKTTFTLATRQTTTETLFTARGESFCIVADKMVVYGRAQDLKAVLERDTSPTLAEEMKVALGETDLSRTVAFAFAPRHTPDEPAGSNYLPIAIRGYGNPEKVTVRASGWVAVDSRVRASVKVVCKDDRAADELRRVADLHLLNAKNQPGFHREAVPVIEAVKFQCAGSQVTGTFDVPDSQAAKGCDPFFMLLSTYKYVNLRF